MNKITAFEQQLNRLTGGAKYVKADFHVHSPESHDYKYSGEDRFEKLGKALHSAEYAFAVVLEHENFPSHETIGKIQSHCPQTLLLSGAEINIFVDVLHLGGKQVEKDIYFHCIVAVSPDEDGEYILRGAKEKFDYKDTGEYPSGFKSAFQDVCSYFQEKGALVIPAHLHQKGKLVSTDGVINSTRSLDDIYNDDTFLDAVGRTDRKCFTALEVTDPKTAAFFDGKHTVGKNGRDIPQIACVRSTDAHHPDEIAERNRFTWVQIENNTFDELKAALTLPHRSSLIEPRQANDHFIGLHVVGDFIKDEWVRLNPRINCFIGAKGSGKTSYLECLRFALGIPPEDSKRESVQNHLSRILGKAGYVECLVQTSNGKVLISRRAASPNDIRVVDEQDQARESPVGTEVVFSATVLGWHEIESVADRPSSRIHLIDLTGNSEKINQLKSEIASILAEIKIALPPLQLKYNTLVKNYKKWKDLNAKRQTLVKLEAGNLTALQTRYQNFLTALESITSLVKDGTNKLQSTAGSLDSELFDSKKLEEFENMGLSDSVVRLHDMIKDINVRVTESRNSLLGQRDRIQQSYDAFHDNLQSEFLKFKQNEYEIEVQKLTQDERTILSQQIAILEQTKELPTARLNAENAQSQFREEAQLLYGLFDAICSKRSEILEERAQCVNRIQSENSDLRLVLREGGIQIGRDRFQQRFGDDAAKLDSFVSTGTSESGYFKKQRRRFSQLAEINVFDASFDPHANDVFASSAYLEYIELQDEDDVGIEWKVGNSGFRPLDSLSAGQRCTAVFPILLKMEAGPLVLDQPEDNLDNRYIADTIVDSLLMGKNSRQFFLTSHNANLVVLTDSDLIVHMDSDGTTGSTVAAGFLACSTSTIKDSVLLVLDGGERALKYRKEKYGL